MSDVAVDNVGVDVCVKLGDSRSNGLRDMTGADFASNEQDDVYPNITAQYFRKKMKHPDFESMEFCRILQTFCGITLPTVTNVF